LRLRLKLRIRTFLLKKKGSYESPKKICVPKTVVFGRVFKKT